MTPTLNWRELALLIDHFRQEALGAFVDRIVIPERPRYPGGYIKGEWAIRLTSRRQELNLIFSIRSRQPYLILKTGKGAKASQKGTHSPFDLAASKYLKGAKVLGMETLERERFAILWFSAEGRSEDQERLGLILAMIPAMPEALLVRSRKGEEGFMILARSRTFKKDVPIETHFALPTGSQAPTDPPVREELVRDAWSLSQVIERSIDREAFDLRLIAAERSLREVLKQATTRIRQTEVALKEAIDEPDWQRYGDLLKGVMGYPPPMQTREGKKGPETYRLVTDFKNEGEAEVPCDPRLEPNAQVEKFYQMARRKGRRQQEAKSRLEGFRRIESRFTALLAKKPDPLDWEALGVLENAGSATSIRAPDTTKPGKGKTSGQSWLGRSFRSKDGSLIMVGRSKDENLELTFKHARGNDIWLHVRGKPGAHALIPLQSGKSPSLEALLDAAALTVYYSGGEKWGKTEVDYTFKKYVKRIKDSTEASYTHNKTILIEPEKERLKRLLEQQT